uniref:Soluble scavenger receptor cysteine-rich domain-containing protein SSC5D n=1 Tax=Geotrypetes seraphini TaxID=260995 RepID=A0A6P8SCH4_GEOSA|nr:soluble scavenger receptor cysteine-rich domain-containing protein SSC5D isoform X2 [Geotrypetes seraphini]
MMEVFQSMGIKLCSGVLGFSWADYQIRLMGGPDPCAGRVEVLFRHEWGTVCDDGWDLKNAAVVCRELGCGKPLSAPLEAWFGEGTNDIWLDNVSCRGTEASLITCKHPGWGKHNCRHGEDAGVVCEGVGRRLPQFPSVGQHHGTAGMPYGDHITPAMARNEQGFSTDTPMLMRPLGSESPVLRLVNGQSACSGRVEVYHNGIWGSVCDDGWGLKSAKVVCRQLGCGAPVSTAGGAFFGEGTGPVWLDNVRCTGAEMSLLDCETEPWGKHDCTHREDAGVVCLDEFPTSPTSQTTTFSTQGSGYKEMTTLGNTMTHSTLGWPEYWGPLQPDNPMEYFLPDTTLIRLADGPNRCTGRVEVFHDNRWGTVCDDLWDIYDAVVVCRELGCGKAVSADGLSKYGQGTGPIWMDGVSCMGFEISLRMCNSQPWGEHNCHHSEDAGVTCKGVADSVVDQRNQDLSHQVQEPSATSIHHSPEEKTMSNPDHRTSQTQRTHAQLPSVYWWLPSEASIEHPPDFFTKHSPELSAEDLANPSAEHPPAFLAENHFIEHLSEFSAEHLPDLTTKHLPEISAEHPSDLTTEHSPEVSAEYPSNLITDYLLEVSAEHPSDLTNKHPPEVFVEHPSDLITEYLSEVSAEHPSDLTTKHPPEVSSAHPSNLTTEHPPEVFVEHSSELTTKYPLEVSAEHPSDITIEHLPEVSAELPSDVTTEYPPEVSAEHPSSFTIEHPPEVFAEHPSDLTKYPLEVSAEHPSNLTIDHPPEIFAEHPSNLTTEHPPEVFVEHPSELTTKYPLEVSAEHPSDITIEHLPEVSAELPSDVTTEYPPEVSAEHPSSFTIEHPPEVFAEHPSDLTKYPLEVSAEHPSNLTIEHPPEVFAEHPSNLTIKHPPEVSAEHPSDFITEQPPEVSAKHLYDLSTEHSPDVSTQLVGASPSHLHSGSLTQQTSESRLHGIVKAWIQETSGRGAYVETLEKEVSSTAASLSGPVVFTDREEMEQPAGSSQPGIDRIQEQTTSSGRASSEFTGTESQHQDILSSRGKTMNTSDSSTSTFLPEPSASPQPKIVSDIASGTRDPQHHGKVCETPQLYTLMQATKASCDGLTAFSRVYQQEKSDLKAITYQLAQLTSSLHKIFALLLSRSASRAQEGSCQCTSRPAANASSPARMAEFSLL